MAVLKTSVVPFALTAAGTGTAQDLSTVGGKVHQFSTDAYPAFGGHDAAPSPLFYALGSLTSRNQVTAALVAKDLAIRLGAWSFEVQGDLDTSVLVGGADGQRELRPGASTRHGGNRRDRRAVRRAGQRNRTALPGLPAVQAQRTGMGQPVEQGTATAPDHELPFHQREHAQLDVQAPPARSP